MSLWRSVQRWNDPRQRAVRRRRRSNRRVGVRGAATGISAAVATTVGSQPGSWEASEIVFTSLSGLFALGTVSALVHWRALRTRPLPRPKPERPAPPPPSSAAHEPLRELDAAEESLHRSLRHLSGANGGVADGDTEHISASAEDAAAALRELAARLHTVELALRAAAAGDRAGLAEDVRTLTARLREGLEDYRRLVAAAGRAVAASAVAQRREVLRDAGDRLDGLAGAIRELTRRGSAGNAGSSS